MKAGREDIERFDAYLSGIMDEEQRMLFESTLVTDTDLAQEFELHQMITQAISEEKEARFRTILDQQRRDTFIGNNTWGRKFTIGSAAIVTLGFLAVIFATYRMNNPVKPVAVQEQKKEDREPDQTDYRTTEEESISKSNEKQEVKKIQMPSPHINNKVEVDQLEEDQLIEDNEEEVAFDHDLTSGDYKAENKEIPLIQEDTKGDDRTRNEADDEVIAKDILLAREVVEIRQNRLAGIESTKTLAESVTLDRVGLKRRKTKEKTQASKESSADFKANSKDTSLQTDKEKLAVERKDSGVTVGKKTEPQEKIIVEYYKSPLNYKGYSYNERLKKIIVYGLDKTKSSLVKYQDVLYLKNGENYFKILPTQEYLRFKKVTDPNLINILNQ